MFSCLLVQTVPIIRFINRLKKDFPVMWSHMGEPAVANHTSIISELVVVKKLYNRHYISIEDDSAKEFCEKNRIFLLSTLLVGWLGFIFFIGIWILYGTPRA